MARLQRLPNRQQLVAISVELERLQGVLENELEDMKAVAADPQMHPLPVQPGIIIVLHIACQLYLSSAFMIACLVKADVRHPHSAARRLHRNGVRHNQLAAAPGPAGRQGGFDGMAVVCLVSQDRLRVLSTHPMGCPGPVRRQ